MALNRTRFLKLGAALSVTIGIAACCHAKPNATPLADANSCPFEVSQSYAWVNKMPHIAVIDAKTPPRSQMLHVKVDLIPEAAFALLQPNQENSTDNVLALDLVESPAPVQAETGATYSQGVSRDAYDSIEIFCEGMKISLIENIAEAH